MKNIIAVLAVLPLIASACDDMNSIHQKYLDEGSRVYLGKPDSVVAKAGHNCVRLCWTNNADSKIKKTRIVYNYGADTVFVPFNRTKPGFQRDSVTLELEPGQYVFDLCNMSENDEFLSMPVEGIVGKVYGDSYKAQLSTRSFDTSVDQNTVTLSWGDVTSDYLYSIVRYPDHSGNGLVEKMEICSNNSYKTVIEDVRDGDVITVTSAYKPEENYIGVMESNPATARFVNQHGEVDRTKCARYIGIPFDNTTDHAGWSPFSHLFNVSPDDAWLTSIPDANSQNNHEFPVSFTIDLGNTLEVDGLEMFMATGWEYKNSSPKRFDVYGTDEIKPGKPQEYWATTVLGEWADDWEKLASCETLQPSGGGIDSVTDDDIAYARKGFSYQLNPDKKKVRYVRVLIHETWDNSVNTGIGELTFYGNALMKGQ